MRASLESGPVGELVNILSELQAGEEDDGEDNAGKDGEASRLGPALNSAFASVSVLRGSPRSAGPCR